MVDVNVYGNEIHVHTADKVHLVGKTNAEMNLLKRAVKTRDDNKCQACGEQDKPLECHHIMLASRYPELEGDLSNIITLCQSCHRKYHEAYHGAEGAVSFAKFMRDEAEFK